MMKCSEMSELIHEKLDDNLTEENQECLKLHLENCSSCSTHLLQLEKMESFMRESLVMTSSDFTKNVMAKLPQKKKVHWLRVYPILTAASLFVFLMAGGIWVSWTEQDDFSVSNQENLVIKNHTVTVPKGKIVQGDITVENGDIKIEGEVRGDVTVINGEKYLAAAGKVTGSISVIDEVFEWIWYNIKHVVGVS